MSAASCTFVGGSWQELLLEISVFFPHFWGVVGRCCHSTLVQGGAGVKLELETGTVRAVFPGTKTGTGSFGTIVQEPKPKPEPRFPLNTAQRHIGTSFPRGIVGTEPEPLEPLHARTVTEPNRGHAALGDRIARSCCQSVPALTVKTRGERQDRKI